MCVLVPALTNQPSWWWRPEDSRQHRQVFDLPSLLFSLFPQWYLNPHRARMQKKHSTTDAARTTPNAQIAPSFLIVSVEE